MSGLKRSRPRVFLNVRKPTPRRWKSPRDSSGPGEDGFRVGFRGEMTTPLKVSSLCICLHLHDHRKKRLFFFLCTRRTKRFSYTVQILNLTSTRLFTVLTKNLVLREFCIGVSLPTFYRTTKTVSVFSTCRVIRVKVRAYVPSALSFLTYGPYPLLTRST